MAGMVAAIPHRSFASEGAVHRERDANCESADPPDESAVVVGFHDRMQVIGLNGEGEYPEASV
jgi:hypothetical protein